MNNIYDIVLNFHEYYYNFFEWTKSDKIKNISKIPLYRVTDEDLLILKNNEVIIDNPFLNKLLENKKNKNNIIFLVSNTKLSIGLMMDTEGKIKKRSSLLFDEEEEVNDISRSLTITPITYKKNIPKTKEDKLRTELEKKDSLIKYIKESNNLIALQYLYYEYYNKECNNLKTIKESLLKEIDKSWGKEQNNLYSIVKLLNKNNILTK